jgi:hypothetical protein
MICFRGGGTSKLDDDVRRDERRLARRTVIASESVVRADGSTALILETQETGAIAFVVDQRAIDALRLQLANAEQFLRQSPGTA